MGGSHMGQSHSGSWAHIMDLNIDPDLYLMSQSTSPIHDGLEQGLGVLRERVQRLVIPEVQRTFHLPVLGDFRYQSVRGESEGTQGQ